MKETNEKNEEHAFFVFFLPKKALPRVKKLIHIKKPSLL